MFNIFRRAPEIMVYERIKMAMREDENAAIAQVVGLAKNLELKKKVGKLLNNKLVLGDGTTINPASTLLIDAVIARKTELVRALLQYEVCDINATDAKGNTAILRVLEIIFRDLKRQPPNSPDIMQMLSLLPTFLQYSPDLTIKDGMGFDFNRYIQNFDRVITSNPQLGRFAQIVSRIKKPLYQYGMSKEDIEKLFQYQRDIASGIKEPGKALEKQLQKANILIADAATLLPQKFFELLINTKIPVIFAESSPKANPGHPEAFWNSDELSLLGAMVRFYPDTYFYGKAVYGTEAEEYEKYPEPIKGCVLLINGILLDNASPDMSVLTPEGNVIEDAYDTLLEQRLRPALYMLNDYARKLNVSAILPIPGIGCGQFAGRVNGQLRQMSPHLSRALEKVLTKHAKNLANIGTVFFDPYFRIQDANAVGGLTPRADVNKKIGHIDYIECPYRNSKTERNPNRLAINSPARAFGAEGDAIVCPVAAADHVSWAGNEALQKMGGTQEAAFSLKTNLAAIETGHSGHYDDTTKQFVSDIGRTYSQIIVEHEIKLRATSESISIWTEDGQELSINEALEQFTNSLSSDNSARSMPSRL